MRRILFLLIGLIAGCSSARPTTDAQGDSHGLADRVDPPVPVALVLGPDALARFVMAPAAGPPFQAEWDVTEWSDHVQVSASFWRDGLPFREVRLIASSDSLSARPGRPGPAVGRWASVAWTEFEQPHLAVRLGPTREVVLTGDSSAASFAFVDLEAFAAATPADTAFVHPRTRAARFGRAAADAYARAVRIVEGPVILPAQLAALLPDTTGLGLPPGTSLAVGSWWERSDTPKDDAMWSPPDLHRVDAAAAAGLSLTLPDRSWASVSIVSLPDTPRGDEERAVARLAPEAFATLPSVPETWFAEESYGSTTAFRVGEDRFVVVSGSDTTLASALRGRLDVGAIAALVPAHVWRPAGSAWEAGGDRVPAAGLVERGDRLGILAGNPRRWGQVEGEPVGRPGTIPMSFRPPAGWTATGTADLGCSSGSSAWAGTVALLRATPTDPCRMGLYGDSHDGVLDHYAHEAATVGIEVLRMRRYVPARWLETWPGYAQSMLPEWTAAFETTRAPVVADDGTASFALAGPDLVVEAVYVPVGEWLFGVVGAGRPAEVEALREAVAEIARSLQPGL